MARPAAHARLEEAGRRNRAWTGFAIASAAVLAATAVRAEPWAAPGDPRLRHDLQLLSDAGLVKGTSVSWPIGWSQVARDLRGIDASTLPADQRASLERLRQRLARETRTDQVGVTAMLSIPRLART